MLRVRREQASKFSVRDEAQGKWKTKKSDTDEAEFYHDAEE